MATPSIWPDLRAVWNVRPEDKAAIVSGLSCEKIDVGSNTAVALILV